MKKNEIIELNGVEYTLELNRDSFLQIDKICNVQKSMAIITRGLYKYIDDEELTDDFNPNCLTLPTQEEMDKEFDLKSETLRKIVERAFIIWLYPNHQLKPSEVKELLAPYFEDEEKKNWIFEKYGQYIQESIEIRTNYQEEQKNLKALANKK